MEGKGHLKGAVPFGSKGPVVIGFLPDAHFHLGFVADKAAFVAETTRAESFVFAASVTPAEYRETRSDLACCVGSAHADRVGSFGPVRLGVGLHPWWVPAGKGKLRSLLAAFDAALPETNFVGEVGLDFSKRRTGTHDAQLTAFRHIAKQCADAGDKVLSLHCVKAYDDMLRILEETDCLEACTCIFHWFSGSSQQLQWTIKAGCFFSVGQRMLASKRGREYVKAIPLSKLLLETDAPVASSPEVEHPCLPYTYSQVNDELCKAVCQITDVRGIGAERVVQAVRRNAEDVLGGFAG